MTKKEFQEKLNKILESMIGESVVHNNFGLGTIVGFENDKCIVKYEMFPTNKSMNIEKFFNYHQPVDYSLANEIKELKNEYESSEDDNESISISNKNTNYEIEKSRIESNRKITFDDVIGLENVKELINQMVVYPFKYKEIYQAFKRDSGGGILLYGAPGTGKTMIAKAIANEIDARFFSIKCSDIVSKWYGESEQKIKSLFQDARRFPRSIIFFDEFDALGTNRDSNNSHAVNMTVSELLAQIDGFESKKSTILLIASTNKPWNIDSVLLRSGRFNKKIYVDLPGHISRCNLLIHELKDLPIEEIYYEHIAKKLDGYSNADIVELCNTTKDIAIKRSISLNKVSPITQEDLIEALSQVKSTIVKQELEKLSNFSM